MNFRKLISGVSFFILAFGFVGCASKARNSQEDEGGNFTLNMFQQSVTVDPSCGARIISARAGGVEFLAQPDVDQYAFGSTFWPSPHLTKWPVPEDWDRSPWEVQKTDHGIKCIGPVIESLGVRFEKEITARKSDTSFVINYSMINKSDTAIRLAPWEVTRMPKGGKWIIPAEADSFNLSKSLDEVEYAFSNGLFDCHIPQSYNGKSQKISLDVSQGWMIYETDAFEFIKKYPDVPQSQIAPKCGDAELYIDDNSDYVEIETQGAYTQLAPGDSINYITKWKLLLK